MHHYPYMYLRRPASRILWFAIGAGVATWWHHSRAMRDYHAQYWPCFVGHRTRAAVQDHPIPSEPRGYVERDGRWKPSSDGTVGWNQQEWDENKERLRSLQKRVGEAMVDTSESALDSIVATAEVLKAKLAERRARHRSGNPTDLPPDTRGEKKDPSLSA
ncbi:hypothetical protein J3A83DRAFT_4297386 [Scleroderma citrinum]